jgi:hypothetical protein
MKNFLALVLAIVAFATQQVFAAPLMQANDATLFTTQTASDQTFVVVEVFSREGCGQCPFARLALATMAGNPGEFPYLIPLLWQQGGNQSPMGRWSFYDVPGTPTGRFNGSIEDVGAGANILQRYTGHYNTVAQRPAPMRMTVDYEIIGNQIKVVSDVELISNITTTNNRIYFVLTYDWGAAQPNNYDASVVAVNDQAFALTTSGQNGTFEHTFTLNSAWDINGIRVVAFVQTTTGNLAIHQAATTRVGGPIPPPAPRNVVAVDNTTHVALTWDAPNAVVPGWFHYHLWTDGQQVGTMTTGGAAYQFGIRFTADQLIERQVAGGLLSMVRFAVVRGTGAVYTLRIFTGGSSGSPGTMIHEQTIGTISGSGVGFHSTTLNATVDIPTNEELWIVLHHTGVGDSPITDLGPTALDGFSNLFFWSGAWTTLVNVGGTRNWLLEAFASSPSGQAVPLAKNEAIAPNNTPEPQGYRIWRLLDGQEDNFDAWILVANHVTNTYFADSLQNVVASGMHRYAVRAIYAGDLLSDPAFSNTVSLEATSISIFEQEAALNIFPNPVLNGRLVVEIPENTQSTVVRIYDFLGRLVLTHTADRQRAEIDISHLPNGAYIVKIGQNIGRIIKQ